MSQRGLKLLCASLIVLFCCALAAALGIVLLTLLGGCGTTRTQTANHHPNTATVSVTIDIAIPVGGSSTPPPDAPPAPDAPPPPDAPPDAPPPPDAPLWLRDL